MERRRRRRDGRKKERWKGRRILLNEEGLCVGNDEIQLCIKGTSLYLITEEYSLAFTSSSSLD